ncbi:MAG TPA: sulfatase-like hydrolase/transferase, partial [Candidatus Binatia bacterium]|nr:sulfatase-like hydrolase/transferase [Candidatus Binatia bacterium]
MQIVSRRLVYSRAAIELFWWHLAILVPTVGFKYLYVRRMAFTAGLDGIVGSLGSAVHGAINLLLLVTVDVLEVSVIVGALFLLGWLLRVPTKALIFTSVFLCLMIMGANQYSLLLVASLFTVDTLAISVSWAKEHPYILWQSAGLSEIGFLVLAALWSLFFAVLPFSRIGPHGFLPNFAARRSSFLLKTVLIASGFGLLTISGMDSQYPAVLRGYWSSAVVSFFKLDAPELPNVAIPPVETLRADYDRLAYPQGKEPAPHWLTAVSSDKLKPRHIVIVMLETAPRRYYPLIDNPKLPVFNRMSQHAIVSDHHYAMSPYTWWNNASILSGTYFVQKGKGIFDYGDFETDSVASIFSKRGYISTFIESSKHGWGKTTRFWENFGFARLLDSDGDAMPFDRKSYGVTVDKERRSFERALKAIIDAESQKRKAMVLLATTIGHYPWLAKPGEESRSNEEKLHRLAQLFDELFGELLQSLKKHGLEDQVLIVVTGDHGFRMRTEFESVGLKAEHGDVAFNVPFLLYAPGLFDRQIRLPYVTSHVDIAPTLLALSGIQDDSWLHHGTNMLDQRIRDRATFMMNTNLSPVSGFRWNDCQYTLNDLTGKVQVRGVSAIESRETSRCDRTSAILSDDAVRSMLG